MSALDFSSIVLAAGRGTRMNSSLPKVLHPVAGVPLIHRVINALSNAGADEIRIVVGFGEALVRQVVEPLGVQCHKQTNQWGTADAVRSADPASLRGTILIVNGDHPLMSPEIFKSLLKEFDERDLAVAVATCEVDDPGEFGRIVKHKGEFRAIVEARDASADTLQIREVNTGIYLVRSEVLSKFLPKIQNFNSKNEFYLTDLISICIDNGEKVGAIMTDKNVAFGVNSQAELAQATKMVFQKSVEKLMAAGVMVIDPATTYVEESVEVGASSVLYPGVHLKGKTKIGQFCVIENNCVISDSVIGASVHIRASCYIEKTLIKEKATVGPFARLRPETEIGVEAHVGNFVEMKKVKFGDKAKAGHLTYLGDADIGAETNIGCGTITCNYAVDKKKYRTTIGKKVFVGSDSQLVAPVTIGDEAVIGSGSTITKDVPARALAVARAKQFIKEDYVKEKS